MHLVFLTAFQNTPFDPSLDRKHEARLLERAIRWALQEAAISADVAVRFGTVEVTATITASDADATFGALAPVLRASPYCAGGYVLLRYGPPGAFERQVGLAHQSEGASPTV